MARDLTRKLARRCSLIRDEANQRRDRELIAHIVHWNCFGFQPLSRDYHRLVINDPEKFLQDKSRSVGLWILASYINHSCLPNIYRSTIGNTMIVRAAADLLAGTELRHSYIDSETSYEDRQEVLSGYGFECSCSLCQAQKNTSNKKKKKKPKLAAAFLERIMLTTVTFVGTYYTLLDELEQAYQPPATAEPRWLRIDYMCILLKSLHEQQEHWDVFRMVDRLLD